MKQTRLCGVLGIRYPVIQGGMAWASYAGLAAAVSNAGGLGLLGSSTMTPDELSKQIDLTREKTDRPFGVNVAIMSPDPERKVDLVIEKKVPVAVVAAGNPKLFTQKLKGAGVIVGHVVPSMKLAVKAAAAGCDFVVAESCEAGGHDGLEELSNFTLIPLVRSAVSVPVVAAGGIVNGAQIAAALVLGADGVQIGTRFVATRECNVHERFKQAIVDSDETGTLFVARCYKPQRILKNPFAEKIRALEAAGASPEEIRGAYGPNRGFQGCIEGNWEEGYFNCGQGATLIDKVLSVDEVFEGFMRDYNQALKNVL